MSLVTTTDELAQACQRLARSPFVTVDTEFLRETTFWPVLCVVQLASDDEALAIDALAEGLELEPALAADGRRGRGQGVPRRQARPRDFLEARRRPADAGVRHPGRGDGVRLWRAGVVQRARALDLPCHDRQVLAFHRLGPPSAGRGADRLCDRRRHPSARHLPGAVEARRGDRTAVLARRRNEDADLVGDLRAASRARLGALQGQGAQAPRSGGADGGRGLARERGAGARRAPRARAQRRRPGRAFARRPAQRRGARQPARLPARHGALARRRGDSGGDRAWASARPQDLAEDRARAAQRRRASARRSSSSRCS